MMILRRIVIAVLAAVMLVATGSVSGQGTPATLTELWSKTAASAKAGDYGAASDSLQSLIDSGSAYGITNFRPFGESATAMGREANAEGNQELRQWAMTAAVRLDPSSPTVALSNVEIARANANWPALPGAIAKGIGGVFSNYAPRLKASSDMIFVLIAALSIAAAVFALVLLLRYGRCAAHDMREVLGVRLRAGTATVIAFALLFLPVFLWLNPLWLVLYWLMLFFSYATASERAFILIFLVLLAGAPVASDWNASRVAGMENAIVIGADHALNGIYDPRSAPRVREVLAVVPENARVHFLLGNLVLQEGNEREALLHLERAAELDPSIPGVHLNTGNLHFLNQDYSAAIVAYERAAQLDPNMAIARYNHSVVAGEQYDFTTLEAKLEEAKSVNRSRIEKLLANPPAMKVVNYQIPIAEAWTIAKEVSADPKTKEIYGQYASFDLVTSALNPPTLGAILALAFALYFWVRHRKSGIAGSCVKCGRTFCHRCKASKESATYCTQCIHIYLKRDGVALDTKKRKLEEVQSYQNSTLRTKKLLTTFLPGSAAMLDGATVRGAIILLLFLVFVAIAALTGRLAPITSPSETMQLILRGGAIFLAVITWLMASIPAYRERAVG